MPHTKQTRNMVSMGSVVDLGDTDASTRPNEAVESPPEAAAPTAGAATAVVAPELQLAASFWRAAT